VGIVRVLGFIGILCAASIAGTQTHPMPALFWKQPHTLWAPESTVLPKGYVADANKLLRAGFGDPRGGEYRVLYSGLTIYHQDHPWDFKTTATLALKETRGWYFPPEDGKPGRAVLLDGVTCEPEKVGPLADLDSDINAALAVRTGPTWKEEFDSNQFRTSEGILLLCLVGHYKDADNLANILLKRRVLEANIWNDSENPASEIEAYDARNAASNFVQTLGFYSFSSFSRGDSSLCLQVSTLEQHLINSLEYEDLATPKILEINRSQIPFLIAVTADSTRRIKTPKPAFDEQTVETMPKHQRIEELIDYLDEIDAQVMGLHSQFNTRFVDIEIVKDIVNEGPAAIPSLRRCIASDTRLTRAYNFDGFCPVKEAAKAALNAILANSSSSQSK